MLLILKFPINLTENADVRTGGKIVAKLYQLLGQAHRQMSPTSPPLTIPLNIQLDTILILHIPTTILVTIPILRIPTTILDIIPILRIPTTILVTIPILLIPTTIL